MLTSHPPRFDPSSLLRKMEEHGLGTKATRANIIDTLIYRHYISGSYFEATTLGLAVYETLRKYCPALVSVDFTQALENKMENILRGQSDEHEIISEATSSLSSILADFNRNESVIAESLSNALHESNTLRIIGVCPVCKEGKLQIIRSKRTGKIFAGCSNYREKNCRTTFPLPQPPYKIHTTKTMCKICNWPKITVRSPKERRPWSLCLNPICPSKEKWRNRLQHMSALA